MTSGEFPSDNSASNEPPLTIESLFDVPSATDPYTPMTLSEQVLLGGEWSKARLDAMEATEELVDNSQTGDSLAAPVIKGPTRMTLGETKPAELDIQATFNEGEIRTFIANIKERIAALESSLSAQPELERTINDQLQSLRTSLGLYARALTDITSSDD